jgi:hypothetical protein
MSGLSILSVTALLAGGAVVTATATPGPSSDVKTAAYGGGGGKPPTRGPCKGVGGEALQSCEAHAKAELKKALAKCARKKPKQRANCRRAAKRKWST